MGNDSDHIFNEYKQNYHLLKKKLKWHVSDERVLMMVASFYVIKCKPFNLERFMVISEYIKKNVGMFSSLKSSQRFSTAAILVLQYENPKEKFHEYLEIYEKLVKGGFARGNFTYIAALSLLESTSEEELESAIFRAKEVYKEMKRGHRFLTGQSDYPLAVLLAQLDSPIEVMMSNVDNYYHCLDKSGFRKGNELQFMSHILSLQNEVKPDEIIERCCSLMDEFKQSGRRIKTMYYPAIALLSLLDNHTKEVSNVMNLYDRLNSDKLFRWHKDMNFMLAISFIVKNKVEDASLLSNNLQTTMETILQAQQAAMIAVLASASVVTTTNTN